MNDTTPLRFCVLCDKVVGANDRGYNHRQYELKLIEFIEFLQKDIDELKSKDSSKRMDIHNWMIGYLEAKLKNYIAREV